MKVINFDNMTNDELFDISIQRDRYGKLSKNALTAQGILYARSGGGWGYTVKGKKNMWRDFLDCDMDNCFRLLEEVR